MYQEIFFRDPATAKEFMPKIMAWREQYLGHQTVQTVNSLPLIDYDKLYEENRQSGAVDVPVGRDDIGVAMGGSIDEIKKTLFQSSDGNLNFIASCKCGQYKGNFYIGQICPKCKTEVRTAFADEINIHSWISIPENLPPFLHPAAYRILDNWIGAAKRRISLLDSILDVNTDLPEPYAHVFGRGGMQFFYDNFDDIIKFIASQKRGIKGKNNAEIFEFLEKYGKPTDAAHPHGMLFTRHIPILNQSLHILTHSGSITFNDTSSTYILQTCLEMHNLIQQMKHHPSLSNNMKEQHIYATYKSWMQYSDSIITDKIEGKCGFIRKYILGPRFHESARGVIVPITRTHMADELELPWRMVVGLFKLEIINRMIKKYGFDSNTALDYWTQSQVGLNPEETDPVVIQRVTNKISTVHECLNELQAECPWKGFPIIMGRNPWPKCGSIWAWASE